MRVVKPGEGKYLKALIFGPPGQGKTTFAATAFFDERTSPPLVIDFEGGDQSLAGLDIDMVQIRDWHDFDEVYAELASGETEYKSIIFDSLSETHVFALLDILDKAAPNRSEKNLLQQQDYGKATIQMRRLVRAFRDLPMHVFFISGVRELTDPKAGLVKVPAIAGQLAEEIAGMMDTVAYLALTTNEEDETIRSLLLKNFAKFRVKVRTPWGSEVPDYIDEPEPEAFRERGVSILMDALNYKVNGAVAPKKRRKRS